MTVEYSNRSKQAFWIIMRPYWGLVAFILIIIPSIAGTRNTEILNTLIVIISVFLAIFLIALWSVYHKYIYSYYWINKNLNILIDYENLTVQIINKRHKYVSKKFAISRLILHRHIKTKIPFDNPSRLDDKLENFLSESDSHSRVENLWYLKIFSDTSIVAYITPLMTTLEKIPSDNITIQYDDNPIIKYGS